MLQQVVNDALPSRYSEAVTATEVTPLGQPEIEVTKIEDGEELVFTAEVDVRPDIELPDLSALKISVEPIEINDDEVEAELESLRARFGTLKGVERPAQSGDFVSIDLSATVDGEDLPDAATEGLSHEVGSGQLIDGLDDAIVGLARASRRSSPPSWPRASTPATTLRSPSPSSRSRSASFPRPTTNSRNWQANSTPSRNCARTSSTR